jgi:hypothetical protein
MITLKEKEDSRSQIQKCAVRENTAALSRAASMNPIPTLPGYPI